MQAPERTTTDEAMYPKRFRRILGNRRGFELVFSDEHTAVLSRKHPLSESPQPER